MIKFFKKIIARIFADKAKFGQIEADIRILEQIFKEDEELLKKVTEEALKDPNIAQLIKSATTIKSTVLDIIKIVRSL